MVDCHYRAALLLGFLASKYVIPCCCWPSADGVPERTAGEALRSPLPPVTVSGLLDRMEEAATPVLLLNFCFLEELLLLGDEVMLESWPRFEPAAKKNHIGLFQKVFVTPVEDNHFQKSYP